MPPTIDLVPVSPANFELAMNLTVRPDQEDQISSVQESLAEAYVYPESFFRLAFAQGEPVGYLLLSPFDSERGRTVNIVRLMIDQRFQGRGLGRLLLQAALDWIATLEPAVDSVRISALPGNSAAIKLYESAGFVRTGLEQGEVALYMDIGHGTGSE